MHKRQRSILAYQGSKFKLIQALRDFIPNGDRFHDVFGGSATVAINLQDKFSQVVYNEFDKNIYEIVKFFKCTEKEKLSEAYFFYLDRWGLGKAKEKEYYKFREEYNRNPHPFKLWILSKHSFSSLIRFSGRGMDMPWGKRGGYSHRLIPVIGQYHDSLQSIKLCNKDYESYIHRCFAKGRKYCKKSTFYFDPPYLASGANVYGPKWNQEDEKRFLHMLQIMDSYGIKFVLSNVLHHRGKTNTQLKAFIKRNNFEVISPTFSTCGEAYTLNRAADTKHNKTVEILLKNF